MEIWEEPSDTPASMCRQGYRLLNRGPVAEYPRWRALAEQGHWLYDTAYQRVRRIAGRRRIPGLGACRGAVRRNCRWLLNDTGYGRDTGENRSQGAFR